MAKRNLFNEDSDFGKTVEQARLNFIEFTKKNLQKGLIFAGMMALGSAFLTTPTTASAATKPVVTAQNKTMTATIKSKKATTTFKLTTTKKISVKKKTSGMTFKQTKNKLKVTIKNAKVKTYTAKLGAAGRKDVTIKVKVQKTKADHSIGNSVRVAGYNIQLGMSKNEVKNALGSYGEPAYEGTNNGCQLYATDCIYYQKDGCATSFMFEFYNGTLDRVVFSSPTWSIGTLNNGIAAKDLSLTSHTYQTESGSALAKKYTETKGGNTFTMHLDNPEEWKSTGWYLCELKSKANHSGTNPLASQTIPLTFDLSKYDVNDDALKGKITKDKVIQECKNMNALDLEKGKQNIYLTNMYRAYHGGELAAYSDLTSQYAYVNAKVRSMIKYANHFDYFEGGFSHRALQNTLDEVRLNEWWNSWQEDYSKNVGYESGADAITVLAGTVASTAHLENVLRGNFAMGAAIVDGYDTVETIGASRMSVNEIKEAQQRFVDEYGLNGISANEVEAALYRDSYSFYTFKNLHQLITMSKTDWINYIVKKYDLTNVKGATEYAGTRYDRYCDIVKEHVYDGKDVFYSLHKSQVDQNYLTQSQLQEVYLHFCSLEYDQEFTQALMKYYNCTADQVYLDHSDVLKELVGLEGNWSEIASSIRQVANKYGINADSAAEMYCRSSNTPEKRREYLSSYFNFS